MQSSNPTLNNKVIEASTVYSGQEAMTLQGTVNKTLALLAILMMTAIWSWSKAGTPMLPILMMGGGIAGFVIALVTMFKRNWAPVTAPLYAACQGLLLGAISVIFEAKYPGIVMKSVGLTFAVMFAMLMGYKSGFFQATPAFRKGMMIAMGGLLVFYIVVGVASLFHVAPPAFINGGGMMGIGFSLVVVGLASMCLILDFDNIEQCSKEGVAKYMEWYCAFSLMVTLVWLYMEVLRLLSKINSRD